MELGDVVSRLGQARAARLQPPGHHASRRAAGLAGSSHPACPPFGGRCEYHGDEWHQACAEAGSALCLHLQSLHAESVHTHWGRRSGGGAEGAPPPSHDALQLAWRAAEGELGVAMVRLATLLRAGDGVARDDAAAARWLRGAIVASAEPEAHCLLGQMLYEGTAAPESRTRTAIQEAAAHFRAAAAGGSPVCHYNVGVMHVHGKEGAAVRDPALALRWFARANTGAAAHAAAALHAEAGRLEQAERWLQRAASAGAEGVDAELERLRAHKVRLNARHAHRRRAAQSAGAEAVDAERARLGAHHRRRAARVSASVGANGAVAL